MTPVTCVKNTFIDFVSEHVEHSTAKRRNKSLPPSFSPTSGVQQSSQCDLHVWSQMPMTSAAAADSDDSTDARTPRTEDSSDEAPSSETGRLSSHASEMDATTTNEPGTRGTSVDPPEMESQTPFETTTFVTYAPGTEYGYTGVCEVCEPCTGFMYLTTSDVTAGFQTMGYEQPYVACQPDLGSASWMQPAPQQVEQPKQRLNSKATAFQPGQHGAPVKSDHHTEVAEMMQTVQTILQRHNRSIYSVDVSQNHNGSTIVISPGRERQVDVDHVLTLAKRALLEAAEKSASLYVLAYYSPEIAFVSKPHGFEAELAVMGNQHEACWRTFRHGSCHYGTSCRKEHPKAQIPVRVFVEAEQIEPSASPQLVQYCKQEFANLVMMIATMLTSSCGVSPIVTDHGAGGGWSIEVAVSPESAIFIEHWLACAKETFLEASRRSKNVFVMGFGKAPFIPKASGFTAILGEMTDQKWACWDVYKEGLCSREGACRWQHPQCLMPVSLVFKSMPVAMEGQPITETTTP